MPPGCSRNCLFALRRVRPVAPLRLVSCVAMPTAGTCRRQGRWAGAAHSARRRALGLPRRRAARSARHRRPLRRCGCRCHHWGHQAEGGAGLRDELPGVRISAASCALSTSSPWVVPCRYTAPSCTDPRAVQPKRLMPPSPPPPSLPPRPPCLLQTAHLRWWYDRSRRSRLRRPYCYPRGGYCGCSGSSLCRRFRRRRRRWDPRTRRHRPVLCRLRFRTRCCGVYHCCGRESGACGGG
jgi:hypothetical protein